MSSSEKLIPPEELNFHYRREERTREMSKEAQRQLYGPKKKIYINRRHLVVLLDILLIVVALFLVNAYRSGKSRARNFVGCDMELSGFVYDERALVSLKITVKEPDKVPDGVDVRFSLSGEEREVRDILPKKRDGVRILRAEFPLPQESKRLVKAGIFLGGREKLLEWELKGE